MLKKAVTLLVVLVFALGLFSPVYADLSVGVKKGDWIEYNVTFNGSPNPGHDVNWARMEVLGVSGTNITVNIKSTFQDGNSEDVNYTLNLQTGHLIDDFIIPANLKAGDTFLDENFGNLTISSSEQHTYAGAQRTVLYGQTNQSTYIWDQKTGVSVEGTSQQPDYSMHTIVSATNMWSASGSLTWEQVLLAAATVVVALLVIAIVFLLRKIRTRR